MFTKNQAKFISSLKLKKNREEYGVFVAEGVKIVNEIVSSGIKIKQIFSSKNFQLSLFNYDIEIVRIKESELKKISSLTNPNQVLAVCEIPKYKLEISSLKDKLTVVLDAIQDPGNLGTIIRIADWFGVDDIICSEDTVEVYNPKVIQSTMGSIARVKVHYKNLPDFFEKLKFKYPQLNVYGALLDGENIYKQKLGKAGVLVIGNESKGVSAEVQTYINHKIKIPHVPHEAITDLNNAPESLNAATATAIICNEFRR
jgi:TrmH family RNA methyltransferase